MGRIQAVAEPTPAPTSITLSRRPSGKGATIISTTSPIIRFAAFHNRRLHIEIAGARFFIAEQQGQGILPAAEHLRQGAGATTEQGDLAGAVGMQSGQPGRVFRGVCRHAFRERIAGSHRHDETVILLFQHARIRQQVQNPVEELFVFVENAQLPTQAYSFYG